MANCRSCGRTVPDAKFCQECGAALTALARSPASERRVVTVLFCDLVGFTSRSELLDPEDVRAFLVLYYDLVVAEVERHGGVVDKFTGDGAMVVFGVPTAHEDDPSGRSGWACGCWSSCPARAGAACPRRREYG